MSFKKEVIILLIFLSACGLQKNQKDAIPVTQIASTTETPNFISTQPGATPTEQKNWYTHPLTDPDVLGRNYGFLNTDQAHIYETLEDARNLTGPFRLTPKLPAYLAFDQTQTLDGKNFVHLTDGGWMAEEDLDPVTVTNFSGLIFSKPPTLPFGWVIRDSEGQTNSQGNENSGLHHQRYEVVSVLEQDHGFARLESNGWLPLHDLVLIDPANVPVKHPASCRWMDVNLTSQTLVVYENCQPIFATLISSAKAPAVTPTGTFSIFYMEERLPLFANERVATSEEFYLADVPWLMFFHENWAIHGAYWHDHFGEPGSHGCINVSPYDARWLFEWAKLGDMIVIHE